MKFEDRDTRSQSQREKGPSGLSLQVTTLNYRKKGQLAQAVRESDLFFLVKRQIKTVLTN